MGIPNNAALFHCSMLVDLSAAADSRRMPGVKSFELISTAQRTDISFPHWFAAIIGLLFAGAPWLRLRKQFSLRILLIATTLVAVVLGLIVAAV